MTDAHHAARREAVRETLRLEGKGAFVLLVRSVANVRYLTGFTGDSTALLLTDDRAIAVSDGRYTEQLARECPDVEPHIRPVGQPLMAGLGEVLSKLDPGPCAFEAAHLSVSEFDELRQAAGAQEFRPVAGWVERRRMIKDAGEIATIRAAIEIAEQAYRGVRVWLAAQSNPTEKELAEELEFAMRRLGSTAPPFPPIVAAGPNAALPHYRPDSAIACFDSDFLLIDWGATCAGYASDLTRMTTFQGKVSEKFASAYRAVLKAQERAIAAIRPGRLASEINREARAALEEDGLADAFTHGLGHGIGLEIHEQPFLGRMPDVPLQAGMVITIEPGIYLPGWGGIRIEDDLLVTESGAELLTQEPRELNASALDHTY